MSVKRNKGASRVLAVLEAIARHQPVGVSDLARLLNADKSTVQRAIMTLADDGWVRIAPGSLTRWQLTGHIHAVAHMAHGGDSLTRRARGAMDALRDDSGETVLLTTRDFNHFVVIDVLESRQLLRTAPHVGMIVDAAESATGRAVLAYMDPEQQIGLLGEAPGPSLLENLAITLDQGYSVSHDDAVGGSTNIAAPIFEADGRPVGAIVISAPRERLTREDLSRMGAMVAQSASALSRGTPAAGWVVTKVKGEAQVAA